MRRATQRAVPLTTVAALAILGCALLALTACDGVDADDWVVFHQNREAGSSGGGGQTDLCTVPPGLEVLCVPDTCMFIYVGKKIGFANYYNDAQTGGASVTVLFPQGLFSVNEITLAYQETKVLEVQTKPAGTEAFNFKLAGGPPHGGPAMIPVDPPGGG